jgi:hypothetical protein
MHSHTWSQWLINESENRLKTQSQNYFTTGGLPPISSSWWQAPWDPRPVIFFQLNTCGYSPYVTSSLTRKWVCRLQLLLALASAVIHGFYSRGTLDHILLSQARDFQNLEGQVPVFLSQWPSYTPRHWVPFSSPPTTRRATVEVFKPTSQETHYVCAAKTNRLMLFGETVAVYCENHTEHMHSVGRIQSFDMLKHVVHTVTTGF